MSTAFEVTGPLPTGVTVLEASAGTGKTYTIAGLAARYVADGMLLERLLIVTFTRMATAELRDRVRERLVSVEYGLEQALEGIRSATADPVLELLTTGDDTTLEQRRRCMADAIADFDKATIVTTHGFCQEVLGGLGIAGDLEPGITFVEDLSDLVEEVVDDLYVRKFWRDEHPALTRPEALQIAREAVANPSAPIEPSDGDGTPAMRASLARAVRKELDRRKRARGVMTYDDLLTRLDDALRTTGGTRVAQRLRDRYSVVLVDEFQDTDPTQWDIMRRAFGETGDTTLVLIGDPKQAIYAFRGADVYAYLDAADSAGERADLTVNWRSDQGLIDAYDALFGGAQLGHEGIVYRPVKAAPLNQQPRLLDAPDPAPVRIRVVPRLQAGTTRNGFATTEGARRLIAQDLANDLVGAARLRRADRGARQGGRAARAPAHPARTRRGARQTKARRRAHPPGARRRRPPRGLQRRRLRLRHPARRRLAQAPGGDRAPDLRRAHARRRAHRLPGLDPAAGRDRRRRPVGGRAPAPARVGQRPARSAVSRR